MYGQSRDQGSDANNGSQTEPAFFQSPPPRPKSNRSQTGHKTKSAAPQRPGMKVEVPEVGTLLLAVYETKEEYRAGIVLVESAVEIAASDCGTCNCVNEDGGSRAGHWLGRVAELQLDNDHRPGEALQWAEAIELSSDKILYSEILICKLKSEHVAACRGLVSRLRSIAWMLDMSRGRD
ncbi:MAG: hypothetical protein CMM01_06490 [Rhodopirellula sp.]|nr:hypothetical protein [Rhodopirellula sp.]OUX51997.1 MAG: hypothetical protein CBE43_01855 [Rhodopirellula sp. TMED283]